MGYWLLVLDEEAFAEQQAYEFTSVEPTDGLPPESSDGDKVALAGPTGVFALGEVDGDGVVYRRRIDSAVEQASETAIEVETPGWRPLNPESWESLVRSLPAPARRSDWLVSLSIPLEAADPAEAVRQFWSYARALGPAELPTFVAPYGNEIEGQSFLLGSEHEQDPEE